jgi:hypothetical protein
MNAKSIRHGVMDGVLRVVVWALLFAVLCLNLATALPYDGSYVAIVELNVMLAQARGLELIIVSLLLYLALKWKSKPLTIAAMSLLFSIALSFLMV